MVILLTVATGRTSYKNPHGHSRGINTAAHFTCCATAWSLHLVTDSSSSCLRSRSKCVYWI